VSALCCWCLSDDCPLATVARSHPSPRLPLPSLHAARRYVSQAYSHDNTQTGANRDECACFDWANIDNNDCLTVSEIPPWTNLTSLRTGNRRAGRQLNEAEAGAKVEAANYGGNNNYHDATTQTVYFGGAVIISGASML
jgi:hypothetical protein